jgi:thymidylate synthase
MDAAEEMKRRYDKHYPEGTVIKGPKPNLILNKDKTNFYDMNIEDFEMICYNPIKPQLKLELGI